MFPLIVRIRIALCLAILIGSHAAATAQQAQPRTLYSVYHVRQSCLAEDGRYYPFTFLTNIFTSSSAKFHNNAETQAQQAFYAMRAAEGWNCSGGDIGELIRDDSQVTAQWHRDGVIRSEKTSGVGIVEYTYFDGAESGSAPQTTVEPQ
jgi:hypothetical protein